MSDLQISLLVIGVLVVGGVYLFNWWQERQLRRRLEGAFEGEREDVLLAAPAATASKVEPKLAAEEGEDEALPAAMPVSQPDVTEPVREDALDESLECVVAIDADGPIPGAAVDELLGRVAACGKPFRALGQRAGDGGWEEAERGVGDRYAGLRIGLQLVNRAGPVHAAQLSAFYDAAKGCADRVEASVDVPDIQQALARARDLDAFCAEVDVAIGINIIAAEGTSFHGTKVRALAEAAGLKLEPDGVFHYRDDERRTLFTLDNHEPAPFLPEQIKSLTTRGVTLLLDVPRVADGMTVLDRMFEVGTTLAEGLGGRLVDDNRVVLTEAGLAKIGQQLSAIRENMNARGISAGSESALRLFS